jgi:hypothetical protein
MGAVRGRSVTTSGAGSVARRPRSPRVRRWSLLLIAGALLTIGLTSSAIAAGGPPIGRIYDCYSYNYSSGFLNYVQALEMKTRTAYLVAPARKGNHLSGRAAKGTYKLRGAKATFLTGPYGQLHWYGKWEPTHTDSTGYVVKANLALFTPKNQTAISCYPH